MAKDPEAMSGLAWRRSHRNEMEAASHPTAHGTEGDAPEAVRQQKRQYAKAAGGRGGQSKRFARKRASR